MLRNSYTKVNLNNLRQNYSFIRAQLDSDVKLAAVVKSNAYGHGLFEIAKTLVDCGADYLCVSLSEEGIYLRKKGIVTPILIISPVNNNSISEAVKNNLILSIGSLDNLKYLIEYCKNNNEHCEVHIVADTGMHREGFLDINEWKKAIKLLLDNNNLIRLSGAFTHFADSDSDDSSYTKKQFESFAGFAKFLPEDLTLHAAASSAMLKYKEMHFNMVRVGIALYAPTNKGEAENIKQVMSTYSEVVAIRSIKAGDSVGYGCSYKTTSEAKIASVSIGYGDGYPRKLSNNAKVIINGKLCPVVGKVCMDQIMVDVSILDKVNLGDEVILMGEKDNAKIFAYELADLSDTITYEILTQRTNRLPYVYEG